MRLPVVAGRAVGLAIVIALPLVLAVCRGGEEKNATPAASPTAAVATTEPADPPSPGPSASIPVAVPSVTPSADAGSAEVPRAAAVKVIPGVTARREEITVLELMPGATVGLEPSQLAGDDFRSCGDFVFFFTWQVLEPFPADGVNLRFFSTTTKPRELLADSAAGGSAVGCSFLELVNNSYVPISVELRYVIGAVGSGT